MILLYFKCILQIQLQIAELKQDPSGQYKIIIYQN